MNIAKYLVTLPVCYLFATSSYAGRTDIEVFSAFHAHVTPTVQLSDTQARFNTLVRGGMRMEFSDGRVHYFTSYCRGHDIQVDGITVGIDSNCEYREVDGDKMYAGMKVGETSFSIRGGTGKWQGVSGRIDAVEMQETPSDLAPEIRLFISRGTGFVASP